jgi:hypothetical protein
MLKIGNLVLKKEMRTDGQLLLNGLDLAITDEI